jgi:malate dehydrogenase (oxaloacetate-decarboxylating)(NADP+)
LHTQIIAFSDALLDLQAGTGIADLIALEMSKRNEMPMDECRKKIWLVDSKVRDHDFPAVEMAHYSVPMLSRKVLLLTLSHECRV